MKVWKEKKWEWMKRENVSLKGGEMRKNEKRKWKSERGYMRKNEKRKWKSERGYMRKEMRI